MPKIPATKLTNTPTSDRCSSLRSSGELPAPAPRLSLAFRGKVQGLVPQNHFELAQQVLFRAWRRRILPLDVLRKEPCSITPGHAE